MRNAWTIAKREFNMYFVSPVAYAVAFMLLIVLSFIFVSMMGAAVSGLGGAPDPVQLLGVFSTLLLLFMTSLVTMRLVSEEQRSGTIELLLTAPLQEWELIVGKWLGAVAFLGLLVIITSIYPLILNAYMEPSFDKSALAVGYAGLLLMIGAMLAIGVFVSTLFSNQIAVFAATEAIMIGLWLISSPTQNDSGTLASILNYLDFSSHLYDTFFRGVVKVTDIVYFVSFTVFFLFLGTRVLESRRWR